MPKYRVLVVGGYGFFGSRLVERLATMQDLLVIVAGRNAALAQAFVQTLGPSARAELHAAALDANSPLFEQAFSRWAPDVLVHTSGPFQGQGYQVAEACIRQRVHYIDLADGREFVTGIGSLNTAAQQAGVLVTSGASSVPALSSSAADHLAHGLARLDSIDIGISPGNRTERGLSTVQGILSYCGKPVLHADGSMSIGWGSSYRHRYIEPVGSRLLSPCDVPDLTLLAPRYPGMPIIRFGAGLELEFLHRAMNLMAFATRIGMVRNWATHAERLKHAADLFKRWGSNAGAMHVQVSGVDRDGFEKIRSWELLATDGHGPFVPTLAAAALVRKLASGALSAPGASACLGLLSLNDFIEAAVGLSIKTKTFE